jgi:hypothetical protein
MEARVSSAPYIRCLSIALLVVSACSYQGLRVPMDRAALASADDYLGDSAQRVVYLDQGWSPAESLWFYNTTEGSNLMPYDVFVNLAQADSETLFRDEANMRKYRYLPQRATWGNPDALPVGFVRDEFQGEQFIGFNCSFCHTSQLNFRGTGVRIDGGPALGDFDAMFAELARALDATVKSREKLQALLARAAARAGRELEEKEQEKLRTAVRTARQRVNNYVKENRPVNTVNGQEQLVAYGYGRLDAFGRIYNQVLSQLTPGRSANRIPPNSPGSYPPLWDTPQHDFVQWNGIADNEGEKSTLRNIGQTMGVFINVDLKQRPGEPGFRSSVVKRHLVQMEEQIAQLSSPRWTDFAQALGSPRELALDAELVKQGESVYRRFHCNDCHVLIDPRDPERRITAHLSSVAQIGTDPLLALNTVMHSGKMGYFEGEPTEDEVFSARFLEENPVLPAFFKVVRGIMAQPDPDHGRFTGGLRLKSDKRGALQAARNKRTQKHIDFAPIVDVADEKLAYKGRPLNGIWATAPYLHNGSVPTLYDLFLPSCSDAAVELSGRACRPQTFVLGSREFDPEKVGFRALDPQSQGAFTFDTSLPGNSNRGHEFTSGGKFWLLDEQSRQPREVHLEQPITDDERRALVEFLKTL